MYQLTIRSLLLAAALLLAVPAFAQTRDTQASQPPPREALGGPNDRTARRARVTQENPSPLRQFVNLDLMLSTYLDQVNAKYDLDDQQRVFTEDLVYSTADAFFDKHEDEMFSLVTEMTRARLGGKMSPPELVAWGQRVRPIFDDAQSIIIDANDEFRAVLSDSQKQVHNLDLNLMYSSFAMTDTQLTRITSGEMTPAEFLNPGRAVPTAHPAHAGPPPTPVASIHADSVVNQQRVDQSVNSPTPDTPRQAGVERSRVAAKQVDAEPKSYWARYTEAFIAHYALTDGQQRAARRILSQAEERGRQHFQRTAAERQQLAASLHTLSQNTPPDAERRRARLTRRQSALDAPLDQIFQRQLKAGLNRLPTAAQRITAGPFQPPSETSPNARDASNASNVTRDAPRASTVPDDGKRRDR